MFGRDSIFKELRSQLQETLYANVDQKEAEASSDLYLKKHTSSKVSKVFEKVLHANIGSLWSLKTVS